MARFCQNLSLQSTFIYLHLLLVFCLLLLICQLLWRLSLLQVLCLCHYQSINVVVKYLQIHVIMYAYMWSMSVSSMFVCP